MRKVGIAVLGGLVLIVALAILWTTAYTSGQTSAGSAIYCRSNDLVLSLKSTLTVSDKETTLDRTILTGDCDRISEPAFQAALKALDHDGFGIESEEECPPAGPLPTTTSTTTAQEAGASEDRRVLICVRARN